MRYSIRIGEQRGLDARTYTYAELKDNPKPMDDFISVMKDTSERDDFVERNGDYCLKLLGAFPENSDLKLVYYDKALDRKLQEERLQKKADAEAQLKNWPTLGRPWRRNGKSSSRENRNWPMPKHS